MKYLSIWLTSKSCLNMFAFSAGAKVKEGAEVVAVAVVEEVVAVAVVVVASVEEVHQGDVVDLGVEVVVSEGEADSSFLA